MPGSIRRALLVSGLGVAIVVAPLYLLLPWYSHAGTRPDERTRSLPGDEVVPVPRTVYTMAATIEARPSAVWPWVVQMGQGRGGFYTHEWVENLLGADIHNADSIVPSLQHLEVGDTIRLTPDPYHGNPGQFLLVARIEPPRALVLRQVLPNGSIGSWAFVLDSVVPEGTRLLFRRRAGPPTVFDRLAAPGYVFMDRGMLRGIRARAETAPD